MAIGCGARMIKNIEVTELKIPFKVSFQHASASRAETDTVWVQVSGDGRSGFGEGCPRPYVTGETVYEAVEWLKSVGLGIQHEVKSVHDLRQWVHGHRTEIDKHPAAWCSLELAILDFFGQASGQSVDSLLGLDPLGDEYFYTAVLSGGSLAAFKGQVDRYIQFGFWDYKVKISGDRVADQAKLDYLWEALSKSAPRPPRIRLDANNLWTSGDEVIAYLGDLSTPVFALEEPLKSKDPVALAEICRACGVPIILDEALLTINDIDRFAGVSGQWMANIRVSKMGGILRSIEVAQAAVDRGWPIIVGAQVGETSLLTRAALSVASQVPRENLVAQEGAYGKLLLADEPVTPTLMFGPGGKLVLAPILARASGWGLRWVSRNEESKAEAFV